MVAINTYQLYRYTKQGIQFEYNPSEYQLWIGQCHSVDLSRPGTYDCWAVPIPSVIGWDAWSTDMINVVSIGVTSII
jgi:hypothetical protein